MGDLEKLIPLLWGCEITSYHFDFETHAIRMEVKRVYDKEITLFHIELEDVCSFSWINGMGDDRKKLYRWEYLDLVSFDTVIDTKIHILGDTFLSQYFQAPNICLEIGDSVLLVEANYLVVNNERFRLR
ncbi:MAG TPA: hypothetical protein VFV52_06085 [Bacilli bacterium]|nr:hypothetical protein [Bacilli bacterium]